MVHAFKGRYFKCNHIIFIIANWGEVMGVVSKHINMEKAIAKQTFFHDVCCIRYLRSSSS